MIPRGALDLGWSDILCGLLGCLSCEDGITAAQRAEKAWSDGSRCIACLSVRSGFDLFLRAVSWPPGSEVLLSAITIPDIPRLLRHHRLIPIPLDVDPQSLSVDVREFAARTTPQTKAILVAHLFGSRVPMNALIQWAQERKLLVIEDCAQAYDGQFRGDSRSDVRMFSFGPIKTATALGGAVLELGDGRLSERMRDLQQHYPRQSRWRFASRLLQAAVLKIIARPWLYGLVFQSCRLAGVDLDVALGRMVRGFSGADFIAHIRHTPSVSLLRLLRRRLSCGCVRNIQRRMELADRLLVGLPATLKVGTAAAEHSHWVFPIRSRNPDRLVAALRARGFDATRRASTLEVVLPPAHRTDPAPRQAMGMLSQIVFLPAYPAQSPQEIQRLVAAVTECEQTAQLEADDREQLADLSRQ